MRTHVDLFSGIGGFSLACEWAGVETIAFAEIDPYASRVLQRHWPNVRNYGDVRKIPELSAWLVTGGVPCQPASLAGKRRGASDDRWLWPQALAAVERIKPTWLCLENPLGILSLEQPVMSFDLAGYGNLIEAAIQSERDFWPALTGEVEFIFRDLVSSVEKLGYEVAPVIIPACGIGALHRRYRVWIMGHANGSERRTLAEGRHVSHRGDAGWKEASSGLESSGSTAREGAMGDTARVQPRAKQQSAWSDIAGCSGSESLPDSDGARQLQQQGRVQKQRRWTSNNSEAIASHASRNGYKRICDRGNPRQSSDDDARRQVTGSDLQITADSGDDTSARFGEHCGQIHAEPTARGFGVSSGDEWWAVEPDVGRVANGIPSRLDRLRGLGNAIVPQVAYQLIKRMIEAEESA